MYLDVKALRRMPIPSEHGTLFPPAKAGVVGSEGGYASERLAQITLENAPLVHCDPQYFRHGIGGATAECRVRVSVLAKLVAVSERLQASGLTLIVWDAWRPVGVQQALYDGYTDTLRGLHPALDAAVLAALVQEFVARPNRDPLRPPPHLTGGAVDVTLGDRTGAALWMGTRFDDFTPRAYTRYFETEEFKAEEFKIEEFGTREFETNKQDDGAVFADAQARQNRRILYHLMAAQGFTNYHAEWWHFDFGNRLWAQVTGQSPLYGPIEPEALD